MSSETDFKAGSPGDHMARPSVDFPTWMGNLDDSFDCKYGSQSVRTTHCIYV